MDNSTEKQEVVIGYAVQIIRDDGSAFFALPNAGFATPVWFQASKARTHADNLRAQKFKCKVVRVLYSDPALYPRKPKGIAT